MSKINRLPVRRTAAGVLAGALALSGAVAVATPANALPAFGLDRIAGDNRYETSARIAEAFGPTSGAILASGEAGRSVDALSANFLAGVREVPVLLTQRDRVPASVMARLNALTGAKNVTIVGGTVAVSAAVETRLRGMGFTVTRLGGDDRYETSEQIITAGRASASTIGLVASGLSFPDALAGAPLSYKGKHPVFLTSGASIPQDTIDAMVAAGTRQVIILGGTAAVPASVEAALVARGISVVTRLGGAGRSETSRIVADYLINNQGFTNTTFNVASGAPRGEGADALSGGALSGKQNRALLITSTQTQAAPVIEFARDRAATLNAVGNIFGGPAAVSLELEAAIEEAGRRGAGPVALTAATVAQGGALTGTITGDFSSVTVSGCGFTNQALPADTDTATAGRQFTLNVSGGQAVGNCTLTFTATPTGGGAAVTQTIQVNVTATASATVLPELRSASIVSTTTQDQANATNLQGTIVEYVFDEPVLSAVAANFQLVQSNGTVLDAGDQQLVSVSGNAVRVRFPSVNATSTPTGGNAAAIAANVSNYTLATVESGAATDASGQTSTEGDAAVGTAAGTTSNATANTTTAPDLRSVAGFRQANPAVAPNATTVDFTFDQAAFVTAGGEAGGQFNLVLVSGEVVPCIGPTAGSTVASGGTVVGGAGTTTITVVCDNPTSGGRSATTTITQAEVARAYVVEGAVAASAADATAGRNDNPLQSVNLSNNGRTTTADLVSAQFLARGTTGNSTTSDQVLYTFDQAIDATTQAASEFRAFFANGDSAAGTVVERSADNLRVLVRFDAGQQLTDAVGASVTDSTGASTSVTIRPASVGVAPIRTGATSRTPGQVDAPELRSVAITTSTSGAGTVTTTATYTFDQAIDPTTVVDNRFVLYNANGNRLVADVCDVPANATATNTQVVCTSFTGTALANNTLAQSAGAATLGAVLADAVNGTTASGNTNPNPIGAELTTGGTGTRTS